MKEKQKRQTYNDIRKEFTDYMYDFFMQRAHKKGHSYESVVGTYFEETKYRGEFKEELVPGLGVYPSLVENFMFELVSFVMIGAWNETVAKNLKLRMKKILDVAPWNELFLEVPDDEEAIVKFDLQKLSLESYFPGNEKGYLNRDGEIIFRDKELE